MKNSKIMKKITLGSATVLSAFTLATAVAPTFTTTVHADDVVQQQDQPVLNKIVDTPAFEVFVTNCYDSTKVTPDQIQATLSDPGFLQQNVDEDYTAPVGYEEDPTVKGGYVNYDDEIYVPHSIAVRFYRPITTPAPSQGQDTPSTPTTDTPAPSQGQDTPSTPTTDTPAPSQGQDTPSTPTTDTPAPSQGQDTPSAPATDTPAPTAESVAPASTTKEAKVADTNTTASSTQETSKEAKEGTLPKAGDASLLSMLLGSTLLGGVSLKRFGKKNK